MIPWTQRKLEHTGLPVGPCAWRLPMLNTEHRDYVNAHPSLIVIDPSDSDDALTQAGPHTAELPVLLGIAEPAFARQLRDSIMNKLALLGRDSIDALVLHVDDPAEIKSGGMLQTMFELRDKGIVGQMGLAHPDAQVAEWLSINAAVRLIGLAYDLADQSAAYRAIPSAYEYGMSPFALTCPQTDDAIRFALAQTPLALPVLDRPIPMGLTPMSRAEVDHTWQAYSEEHPPPPPLKRGRPPMADN